MANEKYSKMAESILEAVGGKDNVANATHCMTRLRLNLKDEGLSSDEKLKKIVGVISVVHAGGQVQVVIGQTVDMVYDAVCAKTGLASQEAIDENLDGKPKQKLTIGSVLNNMMGALSGSITPILPVFIACGIFKMIATLFGPRNLGWMTEESQVYILCNLVNSAGFYFMPFFAAYSAAKKFKCSPILSMLIAAVMVHPDMLAIVAAGEPFKVFGLFPMRLVNYTQAVIPVVIVTWVLSYVERFLKKHLPDMLRTLGIPVLTTAIMLPLGLCVFGPICNIVMGGVANVILWLNDTVGILAMIVVGALWPLVICFGMHVPVMTALLPVWMEMGYDAIVSPASIASGIANLGIELAYALRSKSQENRALGWSCFTTNALANIGEPYLYGIFLRDKHAMVFHMLSAAAGSLVMGILGAKVTMFSGVGFPWLNPLRFGDDMVKAAIALILTFALAFALPFILGFDKTKEEEN